MNKKIKAKWVKALRSGKYKQGDGALKSSGEYCCLGVLCNVMGATWKNDDTWGDLVPVLKGKMVGKRGAEGSLIGTAILNKVKMTGETQRNLARMNDEGSTFKEIADYIEKHL